MTTIAEAGHILEKIRSENPSFWPYGLGVGSFDGGCYLMKAAGEKNPVGFVGWQQRHEGPKLVGYYAVGVLPDHRRRGYATAGVEQIINMKKASVDQIKAFVMPHNDASIGLANKLKVQIIHTPDGIDKYAACRQDETRPPLIELDLVPSMIKQAGKFDWLGRLLRNPTTQAGLTAGAVDFVQTPLRSYTTPQDGESRIKNFLLNFALLRSGSAIGGAMKAPLKNAEAQARALATRQKQGLMMALPGVFAKDIMTTGGRFIGDARELISPIKDKLTQTPVGNFVSENPWTSAGAAAGTLGLVGMLGHRAVKALENSNQQGSRLKVTLPTRNPGDQETTIDMPFDQIALSGTATGQVLRDLRRRLRAETKSRTNRKSLADQAVVESSDEAATRQTS